MRENEILDAHRDVIQRMAGFVEAQLSWLSPIQSNWQPSDILPDLADGDWREAVQRLRDGAQGLSDELLVVLVGDTVTEEALPSYQTMTNRHAGISDVTGASDSPWAQWTRGWTAEENRHGVLLNTYLYLSGRVDMQAVERTTQHLIRNGFDPNTMNDPYRGLIYTSFQERATRVSHGNVARLANKSGDAILGKMCNLIAGDEARHEEVYKRFVGHLFEVDPDGTVIACAEMMKQTVTMPAHLMSDGKAQNLFRQFASVAQRVGAYTARDYAQILEHLMDYWYVPKLTGLRDGAAACQEYLCRLVERYRTFADKTEDRMADQPKAAFSWLFGRSV